MRKVYVEVKTRLIIEMEEGIEMEEVIQEMDYNFTSGTINADIVETEIIDFEIIDSK